MIKTETKMLKVIKEYGDVLKGFGVERPVFLANINCVKAIMNPDGLEFDEDKWEPIYNLPEEVKNTPGVIGMYDGVLIVRVFNYNRKITDEERLAKKNAARPCTVCGSPCICGVIV